MGEIIELLSSASAKEPQILYSKEPGPVSLTKQKIFEAVDTYDDWLQESSRSEEIRKTRLFFLKGLFSQFKDKSVKENQLVPFYKLFFGIRAMAGMAEDLHLGEKIEDKTHLLKLSRGKNFWDLIVRFDSLSTRSLIDELGKRELDFWDFFEWISRSPVGEIATRDLDWFIKYGFIIDKIRNMGYGSIVNRLCGEAIFNQCQKIARILKDNACSAYPAIMERCDVSVSQIQLVSIDRGGRLLTEGLLAFTPFSALLSQQPATAYRGIKIETDRFSPDDEQIQGYDKNARRRILSIMRSHPEKKVMLLVDLIGGVTQRKKREAFQKILDPFLPGITVYTVGESRFNDISVPIQDTTFLDYQEQVIGREAYFGKFFINLVRPFPWRLLLHAKGEQRLKQLLELRE